MPTLANNANVTLTLTDFDSVTISTLGVATVAAVSGLGVAAGKIAEFSGVRTLGPFAAGSLSIAASVRDCLYEVADGVRPVEQSGAGAVAAITGSYVVGQTLTATFPAGITGTIQFTRTLAAAPFTKTAISGAVASAVNSLTYTVQSADAGYSIGVDCTTVQAGSGGVVTASSGAKIVQQAAKLRPNDLYNGGSSGLRTCWYKFEFDAPFDQVQHLVGSKVASGTPGTYKVQFAVTDAIAVDTVNNAWVPMRAGVAYNDKSANGWKDATFGGAASKQIGLAPSQGNNSAIHMSTDVMNLASIPRADGKPGGILLVKVVQIDTTGGYTQGSSNSAAWDTARGSMPWFREWFCNAQSSVDGIATLTTLPSGAPFNGDYVFPGTPIVTNTASSLPTDLLLFTGDSRKSSAYMNYRFANPARMAAMSLSTPSHPISVVNAAGSGHSQTQYLALAMDHLTAGVRPTVIHIPGFSQNGFSNFATFKANNDNFMAAARAIPGLENVKFVLDTDYWVAGYSVGTAPETGRQQCIAYAKSLANGSTVFCFDSDTIITDYSNPSVPTFKSAYYSGTSFIGGDGVHAGPTGLDALAYGDGTTPGLQSVYRSAFGIT
jgi:hypothetical protein